MFEIEHHSIIHERKTEPLSIERFCQYFLKDQTRFLAGYISVNAHGDLDFPFYR
jgi:hypothetical protein